METKIKILALGAGLGVTVGLIAIFRRRIPKLNWPVLGRITSEFGERRSTGTHSGLDIAAPTGTPIKAPAQGIVERVYFNSIGGNQVILSHSGGLNTGYAHLSKVLVKVGDKLKKGQELGLVGNTGRSTGPHLHFTVSLLGIKQNPRDYLV